MPAGAVLERCLEPIDIGAVRLRNRLMMTTHGPRLPQSRYLPYLDVRSRDVALVGIHAGYGMGAFPPGPGHFEADDALGPDAVPPHPLTEEGRAWCERYVPVLREQAEVIQRNGARCVGQLHHAGASDAADTLNFVVGPSGVRDEHRRRVPHPLTALEIADLVQVFAEAAGRVQRAGLDAVEIHAAHGYLINQFLSPLTNRRTDRYGGSLDNRICFLIEVLDAVRAGIGGSMPVGVRIPGAEGADGGLTTPDVCEIAGRLEDAGADYLSVSTGNYTGLRAGLRIAYVAPAYQEPGPAVADAAAVRSRVRVPVVVAGRITDAVMAERIVAEGQADMVGFTRALIADPRLVAKTRSGSGATVDACIACNECHTGLPVRCTVNPAAGHENELAIHRTASPRRVLIVGGGVAGMQCARVAAARGHQVTLIEREAKLGGVLSVLGRDAHRPELEDMARHLEAEVARAGVEVRLDSEATTDLILDQHPDEVVIAVGAEEMVPSLPGAKLSHVVTALAVLGGEAQLTGHVAVIGGLEDHLPPLVVADAVAGAGHPVTLLTEQASEGEAVEAATRYALMRRLRAKGVETRRLSALSAVRPGSLIIRDTLTNEEDTLDGVDTVVLACGRHPRRALADQLQSGQLQAWRRQAPFAVHLVGDCLAPRRLLHAMMDATRQAVAL
jgi:2,4-dienoyl-CoA reductase-like NADH-dependent reductase (Old Yellow Enzyme family)/thioredoxin reductase